MIVALSVGERPPTPAGVAPTLPAWSALPPVDEDDTFAVVSGFAGAQAYFNLNRKIEVGGQVLARQPLIVDPEQVR